MKLSCRRISLVLALSALGLSAEPAAAQAASSAIPDSSIVSLESQLTEAGQAGSSARKKLAVRRLIREAEQILEQNAQAPNRFRVLGVLFNSQKALIELEDSPTNRAALLETCRKLVEAPSEYAAIRLDADLLLSQAELARQGADQRARADALMPLVERYRDTEVESKVVRITMLMALELGDSRLTSQLGDVIAERFAGDAEMIRFLREKLAGQVLGAPFIGSFEDAQGQHVRLPMDYLGTTTAVFFWSKDNGGAEHLKQLGAAWLAKRQDAAGRLRIISINLDSLPDGGQSILREQGLDWPALRLPGGRDNPIYQTYAQRDPTIITVSPTGYAALFMAGGNSDTSGYERWLSSALAREWTHPQVTAQLQSLLTAEFLVLDPVSDFDPAAPPEWKATHFATTDKPESLKRTDASVPEDQLRAIQACFINAPQRYRVPLEEVRAGYEKAQALCAKVIADYPSAPDLWIVRNRRIVALMGLWKLDADSDHLDRAATEAQAMLDAEHPKGVDVVARFCLARQAIRAGQQDPAAIIRGLTQPDADKQVPAGAQAVAALLALEIGDRPMHEAIRRAFLDEHVNHPMFWNLSAYFLDRYHRYWLYHPPFVAGWTYGRREGHFLAIGTPEDARRTLEMELRTVDGQTLRFPEDFNGKWTIVNFLPDAQANTHIARYGVFANDRPFQDVSLVAAVLKDDTEALKAALQARKTPDTFPTLIVPRGMNNPVVQRLGILDEETRPNLVIVGPDGRIAVALSGLTMSSQHGNVMQNVIEGYDERAVDEALARGDLEEAKRLAFAYAPVEEPAAPDQKRKPAKPISIPHLRSRAKVYMAMQDWKAAYADAEQAYHQINSTAGWMSLRTKELDEIEKLKDTISARLEQEPAEK